MSSLVKSRVPQWTLWTWLKLSSQLRLAYQRAGGRLLQSLLNAGNTHTPKYGIVWSKKRVESESEDKKENNLPASGRVFPKPVGRLGHSVHLHMRSMDVA